MGFGTRRCRNIRILKFNLSLCRFKENESIKQYHLHSSYALHPNRYNYKTRKVIHDHQHYLPKSNKIFDRCSCDKNTEDESPTEKVNEKFVRLNSQMKHNCSSWKQSETTEALSPIPERKFRSYLSTHFRKQNNDELDPVWYIDMWNSIRCLSWGKMTIK